MKPLIDLVNHKFTPVTADNLHANTVLSLASSTVLPKASVHRHLQLKRQKLRVGGYTEEVLEWFDYPRVSSRPGCEVSCQGVPNRPASSLHSCFIEASLMLEKAYCARKFEHEKKGSLAGR